MTCVLVSGLSEGTLWTRRVLIPNIGKGSPVELGEWLSMCNYPTEEHMQFASTHVDSLQVTQGTPAYYAQLAYVCFTDTAD